MPRNKPRIQLALYARPKYPGSYHYALYMVPKGKKGLITKHHVKNTLLVDDTGELSQPWRYEELEMSDVSMELSLLVRVTVAKVAKARGDVEKLLQSVPVYQVDDPDQTRAQGFSCRTWIREAYRKLQSDHAVATGSIEWDVLEQKAWKWIDVERERGRWKTTWSGSSTVPILDLLAGEDVDT